MRYSIGAALIIGAIALSQHQTAQAAKGGVGAYLLGSRGPMAGITPPPGVYFQDDTYFYDGKLGGGRTLPTGGLLVANVSVQTWLNLPTTIWVTPAKILGGDRLVRVSRPDIATSVNTGAKALVEPYIDMFEKFNSNSGWVNTDCGVAGDVMQALSHFSYHEWDGKYLLCDLQGGAY